MSNDFDKVIKENIEEVFLPLALQKYIRQLGILSRLRNLEEIVTQKTKAMPITYDITKDYLYNEGIKEGIKKGEKIGEKKAEREKQKMIKEMLRLSDLSTAQIAKIASVSESFVEEIKAKLKSK